MPNDTHGETKSRFTRRGFLGGIGAGAIGAAGAIAGPEPLVAQQIAETSTRADRFSRLFDRLPSFAENTLRTQSALREMGAAGGLLDAKDDLRAGPINLIIDPALSANNPDNPSTTAGVTFFGQFLDHDMTFDAASRLGVATRPERSVNSRTPTFDLDSVYGRGPFADSHLYDPDDRAKFKVEKTSEGGFEDLPRTSSGSAIIPDPRNDEHMIIAGLQVAFLCFHNKVVDMLRAQGDDQRLSHRDLDDAEDPESAAGAEAFDDFREGARFRNVFAEARRIVTWHYQWMIVNEFLPNILGAQLVNEVLTEAGGSTGRAPAMGASRSNSRWPIGSGIASYALRTGPTLPATPAGRSSDSSSIPRVRDRWTRSICAAVPARARRFIGWQTFFNFGGAQATNVRQNKMIDTKISTPLFDLPLGAIASGDPPTSLPQRNLLRHLTWSMPSGQDIARAMGIRPLAASQLASWPRSASASSRARRSGTTSSRKRRSPEELTSRESARGSLPRSSSASSPRIGTRI